MATLRTVPFHFEGKDYEIRATQEGDRICIRAYLNDTPANGYSHCVDVPTQFGFEHSTGINLINHLIDDAKFDIKNKFWEKYIAAREDLKKDKS
jgi:hypothetical protein